MTIDWWTLGIQTVNIMILMWLLQRFFWQPTAAMIARRQAGIEDTLAKAQTAQDQAATALAGIARTRAGFDQERDAILVEARKAAEQTQAQARIEASEAAKAALAVSLAAIDQDRKNAQAEWSDRASQLAVEIAGRLAARLKGPAVDAAFLEWLLSSLRALPQEVRKEAEGAALEVIAAAPIPSAEQENTRKLIAEALGGQPQIAFKTDPDLIAGFELHGPHFSVTNSWRADLSKVLAELKHAT